MHDIMKLHKLFLLATVCYTLSACFKDEPANAECDIEKHGFTLRIHKTCSIISATLW